LLTAKNLRGNWGTVLLPVNDDDSFDYDRLSAEVDYLIASKVNGIYTNGTAGEFHNQTEAEFDRIQEIVAGKCLNAGMHFQIGASHPSPIISLKRIERTVHLRPDAFQVILPDWVTTNMEEQVLFLKKVTKAAGNIPIVLYNPPHAKQVLTPAAYGILIKEIPQLIGIKVAAGDKQWYEDMRTYSSQIAIFIPGHLLATGIKYKVAAGAYSNVACLSPQGSQRWWDLMQSDLDKAMATQISILEFFEECIVPYKQTGYSNPALDKFLAAVGGWTDIGTRLRWPYKSIPEKEVMAVREKAARYLPGFFDK
jgi:dihydrodipicolinate synthase/N-acetylneuraminate lyase